MLSNGFARTAGTCDHTLQICKALGGIGTGFISLSLPVTDAVVEDCKPWTDDTFAISLTQVRILTQPKPTFYGMLPVPWKTAQTKKLVW